MSSLSFLNPQTLQEKRKRWNAANYTKNRRKILAKKKSDRRQRGLHRGSGSVK